MHRLARDDARSFAVCNTALGCLNRAFAVQRVTQTVDDTTQQFISCGNVNDRIGSFDDVTFLDVPVCAKDHHTDIVGLKVKRHALNSAREFNHFTGLNIVKTIDPRNTIPDGQHTTNFGHFGLLAKVLNLLF